MTALIDERAAPGTFPVPTGRGRWRFTLHRRGFAPTTYDQTQLVELASARSRALVRQWDAPAELRFTMNGRSADCAAVQELQTEVYAWRWDDQTGADVCAFRGIVDHAEDQISEQAHTVNFVAHDYLATLARRPLVGATPVNYNNVDQDQIVAALLAQAGGGPTSTAPYQPGSNLPIGVVLVGGDGVSSRTVSGVLRVRSYAGGSAIGTLIDQLAKVIGGFDYDVIPEPAAADTLSMIDGAGTITNLGAGRDALRLFYPSQGANRTDMMFLYGGNVAGITRTVASGDYANYVRSLGNNGSSDPNAAQLISAQANTDASGTTVGWWPLSDAAPSDVNQQATLDERARGLLALDGVLVPSYTLTLRPGAYEWGFPNMGDTVPLGVQSGRLAVNTTVRVVGMTWTIGDDGQEDVAVVVGRPETSLGDLLARTNTAVNALARR
jgi:hypothetical protein